MEGTNPKRKETFLEFDERMKKEQDSFTKLSAYAVRAIEALDYQVIKALMPVRNFPINDSGMHIYACLMAIDTANLSANKKDEYLKILKLLYRKRPQFDSKDKYGRTCLHHAAAAGNIFGLEFTKQARN